MTSAAREALIDEAIAWHLSLEGDGADWHAYTRWLEADPGHRAAANEVALLDRRVLEHRHAIAALLDPPESAPDRRHARLPRRIWLGTAAAAMLALALVPLIASRDHDRAFTTGQHETRQVNLPGGSRIELAPSSRLILAGDAGADTGTDVKLVAGAAYFDIRHEMPTRVRVTAGDFHITDLGTQFDVNLAGERLGVAVRTGKVRVSARPLARDITLSAGERLVAGVDGGQVSAIAEGDVASWRSGRLVYQDAPLEMVAADIARYSGRQVILDPSVRGRRFSGVLLIGDGSTLLSDVTAILGLQTELEGDRVRLRAPRDS